MLNYKHLALRTEVEMGKHRTSGSVKNDGTVYTVSGSPRHVAKTHGSHNGRTHTWPHVSDALDRPPHLRDVGKVRPPKHVPPHHHRVPKPHVRSTLGMDSYRAHQFYRSPRWTVTVRVNNLLTKAEEWLTIVVNARSAEEAEEIAWRLAQCDRPCIPLWAEAQGR